MDKNDIPRGLVSQLKNDQVVLFVGAGISQSAGFPDWKKLATEIVKALPLHEKLANGLIAGLDSGAYTPLETLDKVNKHKGNVIGAIRQILKSKSGNPGKIHQLLPQLTSHIITTNFDTLLEKSCSNFEKITHDHIYKLVNISEFPKYILKLHGDLENLDNLIVFSSDYKKLYSRKNIALFRFLQIIADKSILFIGYSLNDPYIKELLEYIARLFKSFGRINHYILTTDKTENWPSLIENIQLESYDELPQVLQWLLEIKNESKPQNPPELSKNISENKNASKMGSILAQLLPVKVEIVEREDKLQEIDHKLEADKPLVITGVRGLGKTSLALRWILDNKYKFDHIAFISDTGNLESSFINAFSGSKKIKIPIEQEEKSNREKMINEIIIQLNDLPGNNLLFIDNANNNVDLYKFLKERLHTLSGWKTIITSVTLPEVGYTPVIDNMEITPVQGGRIFLHYSKTDIQPDQQQILEDVVNEVFVNPVLIERVALMYKEQHLILGKTLLSFHHELKEMKTRLLEKGTFIPSVNNPCHPESGNVIQYLSIISEDSFTVLKHEEKQILFYLALIPSMFYSIDILKMAIPEIDEDLLTDLVLKGWIACGRNSTGCSFKMHEIYQMVIRTRIKPDVQNCLSLINHFIKLLLIDKAIDLKKTVFDILPYIPMAEEMIKYFDIPDHKIDGKDKKTLGCLLTDEKRRTAGARFINDTTEVAELYRNLATCQAELSNHELALNYGLTNLLMVLRLFEQDNYILARAYSRVGNTIAKLGDFKELSLEYRLKAMVIAEHDPETPEIFKLRLMAAIGNNYRVLSRYEESIQFLSKAIDNIIVKNGAYQFLLAELYDNIGFTFGNIGRKKHSEDPGCEEFSNTYISIEYRLKALKIKQAIYPPDHISIATTHNNLGAVYSRVNDLDRSEFHYQECYKIRVKIYPENHRALAIIKNNIAALNRKKVTINKGELSEEQIKSYLETAEALCLESIAIVDKHAKSKTHSAYIPKFQVMVEIKIEKYLIFSDITFLNEAETYLLLAEAAIEKQPEPDKIRKREIENLRTKINGLKS